MVVRRGFEPRKAKPADLQSALVGHLSISPFDENLVKHCYKKWSWWTGSNRRPTAYKAVALPAELHQHFEIEVAIITEKSPIVKAKTAYFKIS